MPFLVTPSFVTLFIMTVSTLFLSLLSSAISTSRIKKNKGVVSSTPMIVLFFTIIQFFIIFHMGLQAASLFKSFDINDFSEMKNGWTDEVVIDATLLILYIICIITTTSIVFATFATFKLRQSGIPVRIF